MAEPINDNTLVTKSDASNDSFSNDNKTFEQAMLDTLKEIKDLLDKSHKSTKETVDKLGSLEELQKESQSRLDKEISQIRENGGFKNKKAEDEYRAQREKEEADNNQKALMKTFVENQNR
jgi:sulfite reductase beta subunit-like hemoprotein